ncbi:MAG: EamA family transporter [Pacificimonas sp.]|jgi:drug/metabolite transporter (DMT)-like permease|nr:EamA family transporter [Pacificimonas sp.]
MTIVPSAAPSVPSPLGADPARAVLFLLVTGALLGTSTNLAKVATGRGIDPLAFLAWSIVGASVLLGIAALARGVRPPAGRRAVEYYLAAAFVTVAAVPRVGASFVALAIAFPPLLTYLGALCLRMERLSAIRAAGVGLALAGAALLAVLKLRTPDADPAWIALTLVGPVLLAVGNIYRTLRWPPGASPEALAPGMVATAGLMLLAAGALPGLTLRLPLDAVALGLVALQAAVFAGQFAGLFALQRAGGPVLLSLLGAVGALVGVPVAIGLLGEAPPPGLAPAAVLIAAGIALVTWGGLRAAAANRRVTLGAEPDR